MMRIFVFMLCAQGLLFGIVAVIILIKMFGCNKFSRALFLQYDLNANTQMQSNAMRTHTKQKTHYQFIDRF